MYGIQLPSSDNRREAGPVKKDREAVDRAFEIFSTVMINQFQFDTGIDSSTENMNSGTNNCFRMCSDPQTDGIRKAK